MSRKRLVRSSVCASGADRVWKRKRAGTKSAGGKRKARHVGEASMGDKG